MLIGFETGLVTLWDLKSKTADVRFNTPEVQLMKIPVENLQS